MSPARLPVLFAVVLSVLSSACAHKSLSGSDLDRVKHPAFISRIEEHAGPESRVFREDGRYEGKLKKLDPKEADRRLTAKLARAIGRFEISDRLRSSTQALLPQGPPWTSRVDPARVASVLESYLVDEVPANAPDYELLRPLGVDAVVEFVVQEYGMRSRDGGAFAHLRGYARMFRLDGGELWRTPFEEDGPHAGREPLDPFLVAKEPERYRAEMVALIEAISTRLAAGLTPPDRREPEPSGRSKASGSKDEGGLEGAPDDTNRTGKQRPKDELPPGELPDPG
jgi:hypothetical protein